MGLSRQARIITLLVIDSVFFLIELITGYAVGSLALVADSFHMLNDVLSLIVALYTIKLATSPSSAANSYGWQRAEILGALINGVFLVALCVSIALEAVGRIVTPPEISNPKLIVVVGSLGLLSNIVGLFLFHEHGHSHGHSHSHGAIALPSDEETDESPISGGSGRQRADSMSSLYQHPAQTRASVIETAHEFGYGKPSNVDESPSTGFMGAMSPPISHGRAASLSRRAHGSSISRPRNGRNNSTTTSTTTTTTAVPPAPGTNEVRPPHPAHGHGHGHGHSHSHGEEVSAASTSTTAVEDTPSGSEENGHGHNHNHDHKSNDGHKHDQMAKNASAAEEGHGHNHGDDDHDHGHGHGGGGHSHGSMNMQGVFLHVLGDALGNVGVIAAGLVIWFCQGRWTLYFDPGVSLLITCIIFSSALPLVKSASYILMQGVPSHVSLEAVRSDIKEVEGVVSVHELHVWQLSESTVVASVHVSISQNVDYMVVASGIREALHKHGIHSVTIQPEFFGGDESDLQEDGVACLIRCPPEQCGTDTCCPPVSGAGNGGKLVDVEENDEHDGHSH